MTCVCPGYCKGLWRGCSASTFPPFFHHFGPREIFKNMCHIISLPLLNLLVTTSCTWMNPVLSARPMERLHHLGPGPGGDPPGSLTSIEVACRTALPRTADFLGRLQWLWFPKCSEITVQLTKAYLECMLCSGKRCREWFLPPKPRISALTTQRCTTISFGTWVSKKTNM